MTQTQPGPGQPPFQEGRQAIKKTPEKPDKGEEVNRVMKERVTGVASPRGGGGSSGMERASMKGGGEG